RPVKLPSKYKPTQRCWSFPQADELFKWCIVGNPTVFSRRGHAKASRLSPKARTNSGSPRPSLNTSGFSIPLLSGCPRSRGALLVVARASHTVAAGAGGEHPQRQAACVGFLS
ncbi:unnamed protein product, partial [Ectocarpus sp. 12 AP-2014]